MTARLSRALLNASISHGRSQCLTRSFHSLQSAVPSCFSPVRMPIKPRHFSAGATSAPPSQSSIDPVTNTGTVENHSDNPSSPVKPANAEPTSESNDTKPESDSPPTSQTSADASKPSSSTGPLPLEQMRIRPQLIAAFTCTHCETRSTRRLSRQAYTEGVVLARCGGCKQLHLLADHLAWFSDKRETIEDIMRDKGLTVRRASLPHDGTGDSAASSDAASEPEVHDDSVHYLPEHHLRWRDHDDVLEVTPDDTELPQITPSQN